MTVLSDLAGVRELPRDRIALESATDMGLGQPKPFSEANGTFMLAKNNGNEQKEAEAEEEEALRFTAQVCRCTIQCVLRPKRLHVVIVISRVTSPVTSFALHLAHRRAQLES